MTAGDSEEDRGREEGWLWWLGARVHKKFQTQLAKHIVLNFRAGQPSIFGTHVMLLLLSQPLLQFCRSLCAEEIPKKSVKMFKILLVQYNTLTCLWLEKMVNYFRVFSCFLVMRTCLHSGDISFKHLYDS